MTVPGESQPLRSSLMVVSGWARPAASDVDQVLGTAACCRRQSDQAGCVLPSLVKPRVPDGSVARGYAGRGVVSTGRGCLELASSSSSSSRWSRVLGIDAVGSPPHCDFADEGGARVTPRCSPDRRAVALAGVVSNLVGEVGD